MKPSQRILSFIILSLFFFLGPFVTASAQFLTPYQEIIGNPQAPLCIRIYTAFTCHACADLHQKILPLLLKKYQNNPAVSFHIQDYPIDGPAFMASLLVAQETRDHSQESGKKLHHLFFHTQEHWANAPSLQEVQHRLTALSLKHTHLASHQIEKAFQDVESFKSFLQMCQSESQKYAIDAVPFIVITHHKEDKEEIISTPEPFLEDMDHSIQEALRKLKS